MIGKVKSIYKNILDEEWEAVLSVNQDAVADLAKLNASGAVCDIEIKKHRNKRSLNANAYAWVLIDKIAAHIRADKWAVYLDMLKSYGQFDAVVVKPEAVDDFTRRWRECVVLGNVKVNGEEGVQIQAYYGSSTFDTAEMARFIDGIVSEAKWLGIETATPEEIERMKATWDV